jgi:membrane protein CcdC involved in cytochrome C biogenesis
MFTRIVILLLGSVFFYVLRFKILKKPLSPMRSILIAAVIMITGIQFHYVYLPYETFQGGITYTSLGFIAFLSLQYGFRRTTTSSKAPRDGEK